MSVTEVDVSQTAMINTWSFLLSSLPWEMPRWAIYCTIYCDNVGTDQRQSYLRHVYPRLYRKQTGNLVAFETFSKFVSIMVGVNLNSLCQGSLRKENMKKKRLINVHFDVDFCQRLASSFFVCVHAHITYLEAIIRSVGMSFFYFMVFTCYFTHYSLRYITIHLF